MKVLWFEISTPSRYGSNNNEVTMGWQDALENIVKTDTDIDLFIAFESTKYTETKIIDGVTYIPLTTHYNFIERRKSYFTWDIKEKKIIPLAIKIINKIQPDIIHVFGNEWPFGLVAQYTKCPVVIHIQGSIVPYNNALYPPKYNGYTIFNTIKFKPRQILRKIQEYHKAMAREKMERRIWKCVKFYMGRTEWDKAISHIMHPNCYYYHVDEALRPSFIDNTKFWEYKNEETIKLITVGCSSFWKGMDNLLKTAVILKKLNINFEWKVIGDMTSVKNIIEKKEKTRFIDNNVQILGFLPAEKVKDLLLESTIYVHTAYIENSPNSICEAQYLGVPIISTDVGGISTLVKNKEEGLLYPANDPFQLSYAIIQLSKDPNKLKEFSLKGKIHASMRHDGNKILNQLKNCYLSILEEIHKG